MKRVLIFVGVVLVLGVGYWLISPLFIDKRVSEEFPTQGLEGVAQIISSGSFEGFDSVHYGSGEVRVVKIGDEYVVRFEENFNVANGPDLFVGFGKDGEYVKGSEVGRLKGNIGSQNYPLPSDFDFSKYNEVWIWCKAFAIPFAKAQLLNLNDYKDAEYMIEGKRVRLQDGLSEEAGVITKYFGNDLAVDLDGDNVLDVAFLITQDRGGSGTFFYVVGGVRREGGYVGTDGYLLGDRVAPQNINLSPNPRHKNVIVANYADRAQGEPMTSVPSIGKSVYLKLVPETMQWGIVEPDFEGESR